MVFHANFVSTDDARLIRAWFHSAQGIGFSSAAGLGILHYFVAPGSPSGGHAIGIVGADSSRTIGRLNRIKFSTCGFLLSFRRSTKRSRSRRSCARRSQRELQAKSLLLIIAAQTKTRIAPETQERE